MVDLLWVVLGLALLTAGGEGLIRGALALATRFGATPLLVGVVVLGFGTSAPELLVSVDAVLTRRPDIALGNVFGSNLGNILLILGASAVIAPLAVAPGTLLRDGAVMLGLTVVVVLMTFGGSLTRLDGALLLSCLAGYLTWIVVQEGVESGESGTLEDIRLPLMGLSASFAWTLGGLLLLLLGARLLVNGAVSIAENLGVSEAVIGLTLVAIGTSLPELTVSLLAALRKQVDLAVGNILGSNIFNLAGVLGVSALIGPLPIAERMLTVDRWAVLAATLVLMMFLVTRLRLSRIEGGVLLAVYAGYLWFSFTRIG
ncbi:MAG: calcium/sodium antiporter [Gammaproteobacteria bacterium]|nr:calcium/sodium antiporter [Gammaproteobacteria bacterium]